DNGRSIVAVVMGGQSARSRDDHMAALISEHLPRASRSGGGNLVPGRQLTPGTPALVARAFSLPSRDIPMPSFRPAGNVDLPIVAYAAESAPTPAPMPVVTARTSPVPPLPVASVPIPTASA